MVVERGPRARREERRCLPRREEGRRPSPRPTRSPRRRALPSPPRKRSFFNFYLLENEGGRDKRVCFFVMVFLFQLFFFLVISNPSLFLFFMLFFLLQIARRTKRERLTE